MKSVNWQRYCTKSYL